VDLPAALRSSPEIHGLGRGRSWHNDFDENGNHCRSLAILEIIAASEAILSTGHLSIPETHVLIDAAQQMKVERILVTQKYMVL
jgi:hypothetical protein